jgi:hypothetical protein
VSATVEMVAGPSRAAGGRIGVVVQCLQAKTTTTEMGPAKGRSPSAQATTATFHQFPFRRLIASVRQQNPPCGWLQDRRLPSLVMLGVLFGQVSQRFPSLSSFHHAHPHQQPLQL